MAKKVDRTKAPESLYKTMSKVGDNEDGTAKVVVYRTRDLISTYNFILKTYPDFRWMNVYSRESKEQLVSYTRKSPPDSRTIKK